ncbi:MAG: VOC family protein [Ruminococcaceae bacterium]|nr:VOC family protein [Oscillospiraceae bacterium]
MKIFISSIYVDDQEKALQFYTQKLGFLKKEDESAGGYRWLTVVSPEGPDGMELLLEPNANPIAKTYQQALLEQDIPATLFATADLNAEHARLAALGVEFKLPPQDIGPMKIARFLDTCGNLIQINQPKQG